MKLYVQEWEGGKNDFTLKENNSNKEPVAGAVAIQICSPWTRVSLRDSRMSHINETTLIASPHIGPTNPQSYWCD